MIKNNENIIKSLITPVFVVALVATILTKPVFADCTPNYGGGETCTYTKKFTIEKFVKLEGDSNWKDEVSVDLNDDDEKDKDVMFKIVITANIEDADGIDPDDVEFDDMKMKDSLPDELKFLDDESQDELVEEWDNFKPGETKTFYFTTKIRNSEKDKEGEFEKCVVNKAKLYYKDDLQGSDSAVVCYKKTGDVLGDVSELPETGEFPVTGMAGMGLIALGSVMKLKRKK